MEEQKVLTNVIYGPAGSGKSTFANTAPGPRLYLDIEGAARWLKGKKVKWDTNTPPPVFDGTWDMCVVNVQDIVDIDRVEKVLLSEQHSFKSVIVDSLSETQALIKTEQFGGVMDRNKWGELTDRTVGLCRTLRNLANRDSNPVEVVVVIATTKSIKTPEGDVKEIIPSVQGSGQEQLPFLFDITGYLYVDTVQQLGADGLPTGQLEEHRYLYTGTNKMFKAKSRVPGLPESIVDPTIPAVLDLAYAEND